MTMIEPTPPHALAKQSLRQRLLRRWLDYWFGTDSKEEAHWSIFL